MAAYSKLVAAVWAALLLATPAFAAEAPAQSTAPDKPVLAAEPERRPPPDAITHHDLTAGGEHISYKATAGMLPITGPKGEVTARIFYTAYDVAPSGKPRPVTFVFNGGPGAASAFLHLGAMGPRVVPFNDNGSGALQPVHLIDNPDTWLTFTDLVFLDPVETGYSRAGGGGQSGKPEFFSPQSDADAIEEVVRLYLTRNGRALDPVFLAGESYGGFRAALLSKRLLLAGFDLRGAVLLSPALDFSLIANDELLLLPEALALPSIALSHFEATGKAGVDAPSRQELEDFARGRYLTHLAAGFVDDPSIDAQLASYTGLPVEAIARHGGRVSVHDYLEATGRSNDRTVSRYDGSVSVPVPRPSDPFNADPVLDYAVATLGPAFVTYARGELGYIDDTDYKLLNHEVASKWEYGQRHQGFAGALDELEDARTQRPSLRILIASGMTDLVTPFATEHFAADQLRPIAGATPVDLKVYAGGHMMYLRSASRAALAADARNLFAEAMK